MVAKLPAPYTHTDRDADPNTDQYPHTFTDSYPNDLRGIDRNGGFEENSDWVFPNTPNQAHYAWGIVHNGERSVELGIKLAIAKQTGRYTGGGVLDDGGTSQDDVRSIAYQSLAFPAMSTLPR